MSDPAKFYGCLNIILERYVFLMVNLLSALGFDYWNVSGRQISYLGGENVSLVNWFEF